MDGTIAQKAEQFKNILNGVDGVTLLLTAEAAGVANRGNGSAVIDAVAASLGFSRQNLDQTEYSQFSAAIAQRLIDLRPLAAKNYYNFVF